MQSLLEKRGSNGGGRDNGNHQRPRLSNLFINTKWAIGGELCKTTTIGINAVLYKSDRQGESDYGNQKRIKEA